MNQALQDVIDGAAYGQGDLPLQTSLSQKAGQTSRSNG
jgi:hypothetical protein